MLFETMAVCAALAAKEELMTLNAVDRLIEGVQAWSSSRLQPVQDVENIGARLKHLGVCLVGALRLDHVRQFCSQIDRRAFERRSFDLAKARAASGS
jgi:hypothetical protein